MSEKREDPEKILKRIQESTRQAAMGKLKIYLGAAPGVGKTYKMLEDAIEQREQNREVLVGVVETHGRHEISLLLKGFEILPKKEIFYREKKLLEFDLDAALQRHPSLILVDELAHTNMPGLRHTKRWQDVKELLDSGIDVYTTLNVQHIESLSDKVGQLIHVPIKETVPDSILESAFAIELVDLPPEELLKRLEDGKVYFHQNVQQAKASYFRKINLIALRELALRVAAENVAAAVTSYRQKEGIKESGSIKENILVCVSSEIGSLSLIRVARQLAFQAQANWIAVHVASPQSGASEKQRNVAIQNLRFAEQLGAKTHMITGLNIAKEIINFAHENYVTLIMVHKRKRSFWKNLFFKRLADKLMDASGAMDVYVVMEKTSKQREKTENDTKEVISFWGWKNLKFYFVSIIMVAITSIIALIVYFMNLFSLNNILILYFLNIIIVSAVGRMGSATFASILSILAYKILFINPEFRMELQEAQYLITFIIFLITSNVISRITLSVQQQSKAVRFAEHQRVAIYDLNHQLSNLSGMQKILDTSLLYLARIFDSQISAWMFEEGELQVRAQTGVKNNLSDKEKSIAHWVYNLGQMAGLGTNTLSSSDSLYVPLTGSKSIVGVLKIHPYKSTLLTPEQMKLLESCSKQIALALESDKMNEQRRQIEIHSEIERVRNLLLQYLSQDLRTPLASLLASINSIQSFNEAISDIELENIYFQAKELDRIIDTFWGLLEAQDNYYR